MILSNDTTTGKSKRNQVTTEGERTKATKRFNNDKEIPEEMQVKLLNAVVQLAYDGRKGNGSGVILNARIENQIHTSYVLTAKHLLHIWADVEITEKTPAQIATNGFLSKIKVVYGPPELEAGAATSVAVAAIDYTASSNATWGDDFMVLKVENQGFYNFVTKNRFIPDSSDDSYLNLLSMQDKETRPILDKSHFIYLQMGYGAGRVPDVQATVNYKDLTGKVQCRWTEPLAKAVAKTAFDVKKELGTVSIYNNICQLKADNTNSTGPGDSGGPLFAIPLKYEERTRFFLLGVTAGANYFVEQKYRDDPQSAPGDDRMHNNAIAFWDNLFQKWDWD